MRAHFLLIALLSFALLSGCSGNTDETSGTNANGSSTTSTSPSTLRVLPEEDFGSEENGFSGNVYARGQVEIERRTEPFCQEDCEEFEYVNFIIQHFNSQGFADFLAINEGNAYAGPSVIGLGCIEDGIISYTNQSDELGMTEFTLSQEVSSAILNSTYEEPVTLLLTKKPISAGTEAPGCYSHITEMQVYDEDTETLL